MWEEGHRDRGGNMWEGQRDIGTVRGESMHKEGGHGDRDENTHGKGNIKTGESALEKGHGAMVTTDE